MYYLITHPVKGHGGAGDSWDTLDRLLVCLGLYLHIDKNNHSYLQFRVTS